MFPLSPSIQFKQDKKKKKEREQERDCQLSQARNKSPIVPAEASSRRTLPPRLACSMLTLLVPQRARECIPEAGSLHVALQLKEKSRWRHRGVGQGEVMSWKIIKH